MTGPRKKWTDAEDRMLGSCSDRDLSKKLGRHEDSVKTRRRKLGIAPFNTKKSHTPMPVAAWSQTQDRLLGKFSDVQLARFMMRSRSDVQNRRNALGIAPAETVRDESDVYVRLKLAAELAREFEDSPLWQRAQVREGAITIQQQAARYASATDDETRADAAIWAREGYQILSSGLPDTYRGSAPDERKTGWATAHAIAQLFGAGFVWAARVRLESTPLWPDATRHDPSADYLRGLIEIAARSQRDIAQQIGIGFRLLKYYITTQGTGKEHRLAPYPVQFALERLAAHRMLE